jgi:hypothetical protein
LSQRAIATIGVFRDDRKLYVDRDEVERCAGGFDGEGGAFDREPCTPLTRTATHRLH